MHRNIAINIAKLYSQKVDQFGLLPTDFGKAYFPVLLPSLDVINVCQSDRRKDDTWMTTFLPLFGEEGPQLSEKGWVAFSSPQPLSPSPSHASGQLCPACSAGWPPVLSRPLLQDALDCSSHLPPWRFSPHPCTPSHCWDPWDTVSPMGVLTARSLLAVSLVVKVAFYGIIIQQNIFLP